MKVMKRDKRGFTLVELMVTLAVSSIALAGMYGVYKAQLQSHVTQNAVVDTQQNLRNTFYIMQRTIRMAGFDPVRNLRLEEAADGKQRRGIHGRFKELCEEGRVTGACGTGYLSAVSGANAIAFAFNDTASLFDGTQCTNDGTTNYLLNDQSCVNLEGLDRELVAFRLYNGAIERYGPQTGWKAIAENIESLTFEYLDDTLSVLAPPAVDDAAGWLALNGTLRSVRITIEAKAIADSHNPLINQKKADFTKNRTLTAQVRVRNSGVE
jgi:prepilin-type N-terminal cleavage/methylation domain-containing protein